MSPGQSSTLALPLLFLLIPSGHALRALVPSDDGNKVVFSAEISVQPLGLITANFMGTANVPLQISVKSSHPLSDHMLFIFWRHNGSPRSIREILHGQNPEERIRVILPLLPSGKHEITLRLQAQTLSECTHADCVVPGLAELKTVVEVEENPEAREPAAPCRGFVAPEVCVHL